MKAFKELYASDPTLSSSEQFEQLDSGVLDRLAKELSPEHVIIDLAQRHHGMKDQNPLQFIKFYSKRHPDSMSIPLRVPNH